jgi:hypothetical protein
MLSQLEHEGPIPCTLRMSVIAGSVGLVPVGMSGLRSGFGFKRTHVRLGCGHCELPAFGSGEPISG